MMFNEHEFSCLPCNINHKQLKFKSTKERDERYTTAKTHRRNSEI